MSRRKWTILALAALCLTVCLPLACAGANYDVPTVILDGTGQAAICGFFETPYWWQGDGGIYLTSGRPWWDLSLFHWKEGDERVRLVDVDILDGYKEDYVPFVTPDGFYLLSSATGDLLTYREPAWERVAKLNVENLPGSEYLFGGRLGGAHHFVFERDNLYFLLPQQNDHTVNDLVIAELKTGECRIIPDLRLDAIAKYTPGALLACRGDEIGTFNLGTEAMGGSILRTVDRVLQFQTSQNTNRRVPTPFSYDAEANRLFYVFDERLYAKTGDEGAELIRSLITQYLTADSLRPVDEGTRGQTIGEMGHQTDINRLITLPNGKIAYSTQYAMYIVRDEPLTVPVETLKISGVYNIAEAHALFHLRRPDVRIENWYFGIQASDPYKEMPSMYPMDIYRTSTEDGYARLYRDGFIAPLTGSEALEKEAEAYYPVVRDVLTYNGDLMGVPVYMEINPWAYDKAAWEALELPDPPTTMDGVFSLIGLWNEKYAAQNPITALVSASVASDRACLMASALDQYHFQRATGEAAVDFDTPEFRALVERFLSTETAPFEQERYFSTRLLRCGYDSWPQYESLENLGKDGYTLLLPATLEEGDAPRLGAIMQFLFIAKGAPNPEIAREYLEMITAHTDGGLRAMLSPDVTEPVPYAEDVDTLIALEENRLALEKERGAYADSERLYKERIASLKAYPYAVDAETLAFYRSAAPYLTFQTDAVGGTNKARDDMMHHVAGELDYLLNDMDSGGWVPFDDADSFIAFLREQAEMVFAHRH